MERLKILALAAALAMAPVAAQADALSDINAGIATGLPTNAAGQITAQKLRDTLTSSFGKTSQAAIGSINVMAPPYNAKCDFVADDYAALQSAINDSISTGLPLFIPPNGGNLCQHSKPLVANGALHIFSTSPINGRGGGLSPYGYTGPDLLIHTTPLGPAGFTSGAPLVGSTGVSYQTQANYLQTLNLRQTKTIELDGLDAITVEGWMKLPGAGASYLTSSSGGLSSNVGDVLPIVGEQNVAIYYDGNVASCALRVNGTIHTITSGTIAGPTAAHFYACNWSSASGIIDLFVDGNRVARATSITGTITQDITEDFHIGCTSNGAVMRACTGALAGTLIDSVRLSNNNRYGDGATMAVPSAKFAVDGNTIALVNFDTDTPGFVKVYSGLGGDFPSPYYVSILGNTELFIGGVDVHDLQFTGGLDCHYCVFESKFRNLRFQYDTFGMQLVGNSNQDYVEDVQIVKGSTYARRFGLIMDTGNANRVSRLTIDNADLPMVVLSGSPFFDGILITPQSNTVYSLIFYLSRAVINGMEFDDEGQTSAKFKGNIVFAQSWGPSTLNSIEIDSVAGYGGATGKGIIFDAGYAGTMTGVVGYNGSPNVYVNGNGAGMMSHPIAVGGVATLPLMGMQNANAGMTLSSCGTGTISANSYDIDFEVTATGATACTVNFGIFFRSIPNVNCFDETTAAALRIVPTLSSITVSGLTSGDKFRCSVPITAGQ